MREYLLVIDTETSGLPKEWKAPYSKENNWPYIIQISWIIYTKDGKEVKQENHFIYDKDIKISGSSKRVHGITRKFLKNHGENRKEVMTLLAKDLSQYQPLVIGHFMELDLLMTGVDFYRAGMDNPINQQPTFCTMLATTHLVKNPERKYMRLCDLYSLLFKQSLKHYHNALYDTKATAECFFELIKRGEIDDDKIEQQLSKIKNGS